MWTRTEPRQNRDRQDEEVFRDRFSPYLKSREKRIGEVLFVLVLIPLVLPLGLLIALAILVANGRPVLFAQRRAGLSGKPFTLWKFRTLHPEDETGEYVRESDLQARYIRFGGFLRRRRLDELPQLLSVLSGAMSLVGPRPERMEIVKRYDSRERRRVLCKPGVTGLWQVLASRTQPIHRQMKYDLYYLRRASPGLDMRIIVLTFLVMLFPNRWARTEQ